MSSWADGEKPRGVDLADGRTRRTTTVSLSASSSSDQLAGLLSSVALTDLIDADACAGQKLRAGSPGHDLLVSVDGHTTRIRTDHDSTAAALRNWLGDSIIDDSIVTSIDRPPEDDRSSQLRTGVGVSAYVVAPFEGNGPPRVYDRWGGRVARPRDARGAALAVAGLLADAETPIGEEVVICQALVVEGPRGVVLLPAYLAEVPFLRRRLERAGLAPAAGRNVVLRPDGRVEIGGTDLSLSRQVRNVVGCVAVSDDDLHDPAAVFAAAVLHSAVPASISAARRTLEILNTVLGDKPATLVDQGSPEALTAAAVGLAS